MGIVGRLDQYASMLAGEFDDYSMSENLFLYSEQYNQSSWINEGSFETTDTTGTLSPDGFNTAEKLIGNNGQTNRQSIYQNVSVTSGTTYTFSVFLKLAERRYGTIWFDSASITEGAFYGAATYFDLQTGTIAAGTQSRIVAYPNGWYRVYVTATPSFTGTLRLSTSIGTPNNALDGAGTIAYQYTGDGVSGFYIWGSQFERGTGPTDYTRTTTTAITRVLPSTTNTNITGFSTYFSSGFSENVGAATTLAANVFPPYDLVYDDFGGTLFGAGQGRYMRQNTDKSVIVYNEIDEVSDFRDIVRTGLVLDLDAAQPLSYKGTGTAWINLVSSGISTLTNGPTFNSDNGGSIVFDGTDDFSTSGALSSSFSSFTVIIWFYPTSVTNFENPIDCNYAYNGITGNIGPRLEMNGTGTLGWVYSNDIANNANFYAHNVVSSGLAANTWHCAAITYNGTSNTSTTYYNGNATGISRTLSGTPTGFIGVMNNVTIGKGFSVGGAERIFTGRVANTQIYNRALTATEVLQNYNALKHRFGL